MQAPRLRVFALVWCVLGLACKPVQSGDASPRAAGAAVVEPSTAKSAGEPGVTAYPKIHMAVIDTAADEGADWDVTITADGSFTVAFTSSDGAEDHTVHCKGTLPKDQAAAWLAEVESLATLGAPMPHPRHKWDGTDPDFFFTVSHVVDASSRKFVDWSAHASLLEKRFRFILENGGTC